MIDVGNIMGGAGILLGSSMAGAGALKMFLSGAQSVGRISDALERTANAAERQAAVAEQYAKLSETLYDLREGQEQIRVTMSTLAGRVQELPCVTSPLRSSLAEKCEAQ